MDPVKSRIGAEVDALAGDLFKVSEYLYNNPEIGYQEFKACEFLSRFMEERGFKSERGTGGHPDGLPGPPRHPAQGPSMRGFSGGI